MTRSHTGSGARASLRSFAFAARSQALLAALIVTFGAVPLLGACASAAHAPRAQQPQTQAQSQSLYFDADALDLIRLLPWPPANDSPETRAELDQMLKIQEARSAAEAARAAADAQVSIYRFADALGDPPAFNAKSLPLTHALFRKIGREEVAVVSTAKDRFARPRPFVLEPRLQPVIEKPPNGSYPSGHTAWGHTVGLVLADMVPERRAQIMARAAEYGFNRVVAGVHYPSDVEAGKLAATALTAALFASPTFQSDYAVARSELRQALNLPAQP